MESKYENITSELYDKSDSEGIKLIKEYESLCLETIKKINKTLNPDIRIKENGEISVFWEFLGNPKSNKLERDYFIEHQKIIHSADTMILELAKFCEKKFITYSFKLCKTKKLEPDSRIPTLLTSYISANFPVSQYYLNKEHEDIDDANEEFLYRKANGFYNEIVL